MQFNFEAPTYFNDGQAISAYDLNKYNQNNTLIRKILYSPQQLPMDSHIYMPKTIPLANNGLQKSEQTVWEGSFLYRSGMKKAYLGMALSIEDSATVPTATQYTGSTIFGTLGLVVSLNQSDKTYVQLKADAQYAKSYAAITIASGIANGSTTVSGITFVLKNARDSADATVSAGGATWETLNHANRLSTVEIDLVENRQYTDGEIVSVKVAIISNINNTTVTEKTNWFNSNKYGTKKEVYPAYTYVKHTMLYADVDGDLSYSKNWGDIPTVVTTGTGVLNKDNLNALSDKQQYIIERLSNRPSIMTGSVFYFGNWAGTKSHMYLYANSNATGGNVDYYNSFVPLDIYQNITLNAESMLGTFAWNPFLDTYNQLLVSYKVYCNTNTNSVLIVEIPNGPTSQANLKYSDGYIDRATGLETNNLTGDAVVALNQSNVARDDKGYFSVRASSYKTNYNLIVTASSGGSNTRFNYIYPFQIRIPSPGTPVFKKETGVYDYNYWFTKGFYEDATAITFQSAQTSGSYKRWGLAKAYDETTSGTYTSQIGLVAELPASSDYPRKSTLHYQPIAGYNSSISATKRWSWVSETNKPAGYRPVIINYFDVTGIDTNVKAKASYISAVHLVGVSAFNSASTIYTVPDKYEGEASITYSGLVANIKTVSDNLDTFYTNLFSENPHFKRYSMFWKTPENFRKDNELIKSHMDKFFFFTNKRVGDILIVRGSNVTLHYGSLTEVKRDSQGPDGTFNEISTIDIKFEKSQSLISGDSEQTIVYNLNNADSLFYGEQYYLQGDVVYAAEFFEEPS